MSSLSQASPPCIVEPVFLAPPKPARTHARSTLAVAGLAHATHDGYTDMIYSLLPVWQAEFALGYAALALLRGLYVGAMAALTGGALRRHPRPLRCANTFGCRVERAAPYCFLGGITGLRCGIAWPAWDL
jgi:hypothetical protein